MIKDEAAKIILIRSIEECDESAIDTKDVMIALEKAGGDVGQESWFMRYADYLIDRIPSKYQPIQQIVNFPTAILPILCVIVFLVGLGTNYFGPSGKIHIIINPILVLVAWNLIVYIFLLIGIVFTSTPLRILFAKASQFTVSSTDSLKENKTYKNTTTKTSRNKLKVPWVLRKVFLYVWMAIFKIFIVTTHKATLLASVAKRFWNHWIVIAEPLLISQWRLLLHGCSIFLTLGTIIGIYIRGFFFDYNVVWASTFIKSEDTVLLIIKIVLGPAIFLASLVGLDMQEYLDVTTLMSSKGIPAAQWIYLYTILSIAIIFLPRAVMYIYDKARIRHHGQNIQIVFDDYFRNKIEDRLGTFVHQTVENCFEELSNDVADFVCEGLYDNQIVHEIETFRNEGGKIVDLRSRITKKCKNYEPEIKSYMNNAVDNFEKSIAFNIQNILNNIPTNPTVDRNILNNTNAIATRDSENVIEQSIKTVENKIIIIINTCVTAAIVATFGAISGGLGESIGVAIITGLLGTTGPIGFIIGAILGLVAAAGTLWYGKEKIKDATENITIPATILKMVLRESKYNKVINEGRNNIKNSIKEELHLKFEPLLPKISDEIWTGIKKVW